MVYMPLPVLSALRSPLGLWCLLVQSRARLRLSLHLPPGTSVRVVLTYSLSYSISSRDLGVSWGQAWIPRPGSFSSDTQVGRHRRISHSSHTQVGHHRRIIPPSHILMGHLCPVSPAFHMLPGHQCLCIVFFQTCHRLSCAFLTRLSLPSTGRGRP